MQEIRSILVVLEPDQPEGLALKRARLIAGATQSELHLVVCDGQQDHGAWLGELADALREEGYSVSTRQNWQESTHQTIIAAQQDEGCGLVIKQHYPDNPLKKALLTPDDWKLLRYCPCPVLLVKTDRPWTGGNVLAAVDVGNDDPEHRTLHERGNRGPRGECDVPLAVMRLRDPAKLERHATKDQRKKHGDQRHVERGHEADNNRAPPGRRRVDAHHLRDSQIVNQ